MPGEGMVIGQVGTTGYVGTPQPFKSVPDWINPRSYF